MNEKKYDDISVELNYILSIFQGVKDHISRNLNNYIGPTFESARLKSDGTVERFHEYDNQLSMIDAALQNGCNELKKIIDKGVYTEYEAENPD